MVPRNPDLTRSNKIPGVYVYNLLNSAGSGTEDEPRTLLLLGELLATGLAAPNTIVQNSSATNGAFIGSTNHSPGAM